MSEDAQQTIWKSFLAATGGPFDGSGSATDSGFAGSTAPSNALPARLEVGSRVAVGPAFTQASPADIFSTIQPIFSDPAPATSSAGVSSQPGDSSTASSVLTTVLKSGPGLTPLLSGILSLFGGGSDPAPPPLVKYAAPPSVRFEAAQWGDQSGDVDYDQAGLPRLNSSTAANTGRTNASQTSTSNGPEPTTAAAPTVTVNVQAMDSRSFLDHSQEIARAVREAMLNLNAINDVVSDL